jgi:hypothetical protein
VTVGTLLPFVCMVAALRLIPAPRAAVVATLEPVLAAVFAWVFHDEVLAVPQLAGGAVVLAAVVWSRRTGPTWRRNRPRRSGGAGIDTGLAAALRRICEREYDPAVSEPEGGWELCGYEGW